MSLAQKTLDSSFFILIIRGIQRSIGIVSLLILARLLTPEDFGLVAIATMLVFLCDVLSDSGAQQYIVQKDEVDDDDLNTAWTLGILLKTGLAVILIACAWPLALFFEQPKLFWPLIVISSILPISAFISPGILLQKRELNYQPLVRLAIVDKLGSFVITLSLAYALKSYWAMIIGVVASYVIKASYSYVIAKYSPRFTLSKLLNQWSFSKWMLLKAVLGYIKSEFDTIFISKSFSTGDLGGYNMMKNISTLPGREVIQPLSEPLLATFAKVKGDKRSINFQILTSVTLLLSITSPIAGILFLYDEYLVSTLFDEKWQVFAPILGILSFFIINYSIVAIFQQALTSVSKVKLLFYYDLITFAAMLAAFLLFFSGDLVVFAEWRIIIAAVSLLLIVAVVWFYFSFSLFAFAGLLIPIVFANYLASFSQYLFFSELAFLNLLILSAIYGALYIITLCISFFLMKFINRDVDKTVEWITQLLSQQLSRFTAKVKRS
ncbi:oligosaccharide flippase family protein [Agaribacter marinus]|uniref:Membrane protein involved in the export of O-antigen and teichoic acid n=1 Tax=Agaribacter marinus TaxID=1431249 RepID=A0AA37SZP9_9ALTE|nr:oligosaccharide flippase family protein [Agaribacter marinus]GLR70931.1 hypothetical protein GCM10007852_18390 [Agaribacter marinus]